MRTYSDWDVIVVAISTNGTVTVQLDPDENALSHATIDKALDTLRQHLENSEARRVDWATGKNGNG